MQTPTPTALEFETETVMAWMQYLTSNEVHETLLKKRDTLRDLQMQFLFEVGEIHVQMLENQGETALPTSLTERKHILNRNLNLIDLYLLVVHCFLKKRNYMEQLLNPHTPDLQVMNQQGYFRKLEQVVQAEIITIRSILSRNLDFHPEINFEEMPWRAFQLSCFQDPSE
jgi:hypothetical protein